MKPIVINIPGDPKAKGRPRFFRAGKGVRATTPKDTLTYENWVRECALKVLPDGWEPLDCPLSVAIEVTVERPKKPKAEWPQGRPDLDNYVKAVIDGLGLARVFVDDARICDLVASKGYGTPGVVVDVREI